MSGLAFIQVSEQSMAIRMVTFSDVAMAEVIETWGTGAFAARAVFGCGRKFQSCNLVYP